MSEFIHYTAESLSKIQSRVQKPEPTFKPTGLWLSVGDTWKQWCEGEEWGLDRLKYKYLIKLASSTSILWLKTITELDEFSAEYKRQPGWIPNSNAIISDFALFVDWKGVAAKWQGIIIDPYQWERRLLPSCFWYYTWDCASGCIWDSKAIASMEALGG